MAFINQKLKRFVWDNLDLYKSVETILMEKAIDVYRENIKEEKFYRDSYIINKGEQDLSSIEKILMTPDEIWEKLKDKTVQECSIQNIPAEKWEDVKDKKIDDYLTDKGISKENFERGLKVFSRIQVLSPPLDLNLKSSKAAKKIKNDIIAMYYGIGQLKGYIYSMSCSDLKRNPEYKEHCFIEWCGKNKKCPKYEGR